MKILLSGDKIIIYAQKAIINNIEEDNLEECIRNIILKLKKKRIKNLSGIYNVTVFKNDKYGIIIEMEKDEDLEFFPNIIDLKIKTKSNHKIYFLIDDYFLIKDKKYIKNKDNYYVDIDNLDEKEILQLIEFSKIIYNHKY